MAEPENVRHQPENEPDPSATQTAEARDSSDNTGKEAPHRSRFSSRYITGGIVRTAAAISLGVAAVLGCAKKDDSQGSSSAPSRPQVTIKVPLSPTHLAAMKKLKAGKATDFGKKDIPLLSEIFNNSGDIEASLQAIRVIGKIGGIEAAECLIQQGGLRSHPYGMMLKERVERDPRYDRPLEFWYMNYVTFGGCKCDVANETVLAFRDIGQPAVQPLLQALNDPAYSDVHGAVARALGMIGDRRAVEPLIKILNDEDEQVRKEAIYALGELGDARAFKPLIHMLEDKEQKVREKAIEALGKLGDARAVKPLVKIMLGKEDGRNNYTAAEALGNLGDARAVEPLIQALHNTKLVSWGAAKSLGKLKDPRAVEPLIEALRQDEYIRKLAIEALGELRDTRAVMPLIDLLKGDNKEDKDQRAYVAKALGNLHDERAVQPLLEVLNRKNEYPYGDYHTDVTDALVELGHRMAIADALVEIGNEEAIKGLIGALRNDDSSIHCSAYHAFAFGSTITNKDAIKLLQQVMGDTNQNVSYAAKKALERIPKSEGGG